MNDSLVVDAPGTGSLEGESSRLDAVRRDPRRLSAVYATGLLDSEVEECFDRLTRLAVRLTGVPAAFISLVDENRDFYKSACGFGEPLASARELEGPTFCHYTVASSAPVIIPDTKADPRYAHIPTIYSLGVAAYVGVPLITDGQTIGAFCAIDGKPRDWTAGDIEAFTELALIAVQEIEMRSLHRRTEEMNEQLQEQAVELEVQKEELELAATDMSRQVARYRTLTEAVPVQVWTATPDGLLDFASVQAMEYFCVPESEVLGTGWTQFVHPEDLPAAAALWAQSLRSGEPYQAEFRLLNGETDEYRWHLARALPHRDANGDIIGWMGTNTDVSDERRARADAEKANLAKSEFLALMSHELRTPLNAIGGYSELMQLEVHGPVTDAQRQDLDRILWSQRHLLGLINGILNFAKVDAGMITYLEETVPLDEVIIACESLAIGLVRNKLLTLAFPPRGQKLEALADREKVQQIVLNLLSNSVKFTPNGGAIAVSFGIRDDRAFVDVTDTGVGIPHALQERVFQPFVQVDGRLTRQQEGTGLGLSISRDLARGMNGDLTLVSTPGAGSTFTLSLPLPPA